MEDRPLVNSRWLHLKPLSKGILGFRDLVGGLNIGFIFGGRGLGENHEITMHTLHRHPLIPPNLFLPSPLSVNFLAWTALGSCYGIPLDKVVENKRNHIESRTSSAKK